MGRQSAVHPILNADCEGTMKTHRDLPFRQDNQHDMDEYYHLIYDTVNSMRCIATAMYDATEDASDLCEEPEDNPWLFSYDPDMSNLKGWPGEGAMWDISYQIVNLTNISGEKAYEQCDKQEPVDFIFIDTDPHSYPQTLNWLNTWVKELLAPAGIAMFHDTNWAKGVMQALTEFLLENWEDFYLELVGGKFGMGILRRKDREQGIAD